MTQYSILFEDEHLLIINKPALLSVQTESNEDSLETLLKEKYAFVGIVHRIDQRVSGLVLIAKNALALDRINIDFKENLITKKYLAIIAGKPLKESATLTHWLVKSKNGNRTKAYLEMQKTGKKAILDYQLIQSSERYSLLEIDLKTGRFHQIRAQLAAIGCPIVGDLKYGYPRSSVDGSIFLHAFQLKFIHPISHEELIFTLEKPVIWSKFGF